MEWSGCFNWFNFSFYSGYGPRKLGKGHILLVYTAEQQGGSRSCEHEWIYIMFMTFVHDHMHTLTFTWRCRTPRLLSKFHIFPSVFHLLSIFLFPTKMTANWSGFHYGIIALGALVNHRYVKSRSDAQLRGNINADVSSCEPEDKSNGQPIVPCGLIAWSLFNDTYNFSRNSQQLAVNRRGISWKSDREHKFGKDVYPRNFQNGTLIGGKHLDNSIPVSFPLMKTFGLITHGCFSLNEWLSYQL